MMETERGYLEEQERRLYERAEKRQACDREFQRGHGGLAGSIGVSATTRPEPEISALISHLANRLELLAERQRAFIERLNPVLNANAPQTNQCGSPCPPPPNTALGGILAGFASKVSQITDLVVLADEALAL